MFAFTAGPRERAVRTPRSTIGGALACAIAVALVAGCGAQSSKADSANADSTADSTGRPQSKDSKDSAEESAGESAQSAGVEEAGVGETQSGGWGSENNPLSWDMVGVNDGPLGSLEPFRKGWGSDLCTAVKGFRDFTRFGVPGRAVEVWLYPEREKYTLICSAPSASIWANTTGPGGSGLSVPCPEWAPHVDKRTRGLYMADSRGVNMRNLVTQSSGGYGSGGDGLWNYKFHNWSTSELKPTIWALCRTTPTP